MRRIPITPTVRIVIRSTTSRVPFRGDTYSARLEDEDTQEYTVRGTTRGHDTWWRAAQAALRLADRRGFRVLNRELIERRLTGPA
jgi:hypothetical protein